MQVPVITSTDHYNYLLSFSAPKWNKIGAIISETGIVLVDITSDIIIKRRGKDSGFWR